MIELHRTGADAYADEVEERLQEMVLAHRVVNHAPSGDGEDSGQALETTVRDGDREYRGRDEIDPWLDELVSEVSLGRQFQSDACYLDPDDPSRCL